jgi:hypothetical protein
MVACAVCHIRYDVSARTHRDIKARRVEPRCVLHRRRRARSGTVTAAHRRYWLDRFSLDEIVEMATAIWPMPSSRNGNGLRPALVASSSPARARDGE